jgi:hypothetical protein
VGARVRRSNAKCDLGALSMVLLVASPAAADDGWRLTLVRGDGAEACPDEAALIAEAESIAGRAVFGAENTRRIDGSIERTDSGFHAVVRVFDEAGTALGERGFTSEGESCDELGHALALGIALIVDGGLVPADEPAPVEDPPRVIRPGPRREPAAMLDRPDMSRVVPHEDPRGPMFGVSVGATLGELPSVALSLGAHARVMLGRRYSAEAAVVAALPAAEPVPPDASAEFWSLGLELAICPYDDRAGGMAFAICAGGAVGLIVSRAVGFPRAENALGFHAGPLAGARLSVTLAEGLALELLATLEVDLVGTDFTVIRGGVSERIYEVFPVIARLSLGLALDLGATFR